VEYLGPFDEVEIAATGLVVKKGQVVDLYPNLAGRAPDGDDPGEGLLAQVDTWRVVVRPAAKSKSTVPAEEA
jgi:hypothetical protein